MKSMRLREGPAAGLEHVAATACADMRVLNESLMCGISGVMMEPKRNISQEQKWLN